MKYISHVPGKNDTFYDYQYFWSLMQCIELYMLYKFVDIFEKLIEIKISIKIKLQAIEAN